MNTFDLLNQFAEKYGVANEKVPEFIDKINNVNTLYGLLDLPKDVLAYYNYKNKLKNEILKYVGECSLLKHEIKKSNLHDEDKLEFERLLNVRQSPINTKFNSFK